MFASCAFIAGLATASVQAQHAHEPGAHANGHENALVRPADPSKATRTIRVDMTDNMRFTPAEIRVRRGEIVRFVPTNKGQVAHEMVFGTMEQLENHAAMMRQAPMKHDESDEEHVAPGKSGEVALQFNQAGEVYYACLVPGHFEAGMLGKVIVSP